LQNQNLSTSLIASTLSYRKQKNLSKPTFGMQLICPIRGTCTELTQADKYEAQVLKIQPSLIIGLDPTICMLIAKIRKSVIASTMAEELTLQSVEHKQHNHQ
jgi:intracellular septation protein A